QFRPDVYEPNETPAQSTSIASNGGPWQLTFFADPDGNGKGQADTDVFRISATQGVVYTVTTSNLVSDANTNLEILDTNGTTVLASNNDCPGFTDGSSCLTVTAPRTDTFYIRVKHATDAGIYGSYSLQVTNP
ncbi:MAG TPA: PPC domain-containing protein, partial [Candidatus Polarisedimenticolaceae bacterium]|nr:PPC domain-containing protein [Candidatus Polarisedimenticolaceae bacterium]